MFSSGVMFGIVFSLPFYVVWHLVAIFFFFGGGGGGGSISFYICRILVFDFFEEGAGILPVQGGLYWCPEALAICGSTPMGV